MPADRTRCWETPWISLAGAITAVVGVIVLAGWCAHNLFLIQLAPSSAPMQRNTALGFVLSGAGLLLCVRGERWRGAGQVCGLAVGMLGLLTLLEYLFALNLRIDQLLGPGLVLVKTSNPGRMSPLTAIGFVLTGSSIALARSRTSPHVRSLVVSFSGTLQTAIGTASIFSYSLGNGATFGWTQVTFMGAHTATAFFLLGAGLAVRAWSDHERERLAVGIAAPHPPPRWVPWCADLGLATVLLSLWQGVVANRNAGLGLSRLAGLVAAVLLVFLVVLVMPIGFRDKLATGIGLALLVVAFVGVFSYRSVIQNEEQRW